MAAPPTAFEQESNGLSSLEPSASRCCIASHKGSSPADRGNNTSNLHKVRTRNTRRLDNNNRANPIRHPTTAAEGGSHDEAAAEAMVMKSVEFAKPVEFAKMAVVESAAVKFAKGGVKFATVESRKSGVESATMECRKPAVESTTMEPAAVESAAA